MAFQPYDSECRVCGRPLRVQTGKRGGRPREYCSRQCSLLQYHLGKAQELVLAIAEGEGMTEEGLRSLRGELWRLGNLVRPAAGTRRAGTTFWTLRLACGHRKTDKARRRLREGVSTLDPAPGSTWCPACKARVTVEGALLEVEGK